MTTPDSDPLAAFYAAFSADPVLREFYGDSGYANVGYWRSDTASAAQACDDLVDELLGPVPASTAAVLDVACGAGATTRRIAERLQPQSLVGIGLGADSLASARRRAPTAHFARMDAARLAFESECFDAVVCVEAAFHFDTRARFLSEALRVLKPGGALVLSDLLLARGTPLAPDENHLASPAAYARLLTRVGFGAVTLTDVTPATWRAYRRRLTAFIVRRGRLGAIALRDLLAANVALAWAVRHCVLVSARKPAD
jgi:ubiquinone/menaquinone biosynthesis C-methylase UbiE